MNSPFKTLWALLTTAVMALPAMAERVLDLANIQGIRQNQLIGYGLVVGLDGTGEQTPFTSRSTTTMLQQMGVNLPPGTDLKSKNVASVVVTASLASFAQTGQTLDITVSSMGSAKSLRGGTLLMTPLKGADGQIYAVAQGNVLVGGVGASSGGASTQVNHLSVGRISAGATVERSVPTPLGQGEYVMLELKESNFGTATRLADALKKRFGSDAAEAQNSRVIRVRAPMAQDARVGFLAELEAIEVIPAQIAAKVIINGRTGSVVMNHAVTLDACAVAHGGLSIVITAAAAVSQPPALSGGQTVVVQSNQIEIQKESGRVLLLSGGVMLSDVVKTLNSVGVTPQDLLAILQAMKVAGALRAEIEVI